MTRTWAARAAVLVSTLGATACGGEATERPPRASGYVEATEIHVAAKVPGRVDQVNAVEGARVEAGDLLVQLATTDVDLALRRAQAERAQAEAQLRLLQAGARPEDVAQAEAQVAAAEADRRAAETEREAARSDEARFQQLLDRRAGSEKQRDDSRTRQQVATARLAAANDRIRAAEAVVARLRAGARPEELAGARARVASADAQIAALDQSRADATIVAPSPGIVVARLVEPGELVGTGTPVAVMIDLDRAWANAYVEEPIVPGLRLNQEVTVVTDGGDRLPGTIAFISPRAEFTPRNVQTADERARLVYRVKVTVDNRAGVLKPGMPVEVELPR
jgi:HlyD family secretion protein